jgi:hypothetical protein
MLHILRKTPVGVPQHFWPVGAYRVAERQVIGGLSSTGAVGADFLLGWNGVPNLPAETRRHCAGRMRCGTVLHEIVHASMRLGQAQPGRPGLSHPESPSPRGLSPNKLRPGFSAPTGMEDASQLELIDQWARADYTL